METLPTKQYRTKVEFVIVAQFRIDGMDPDDDPDEYFVLETLQDGDNITERLAYWNSEAYRYTYTDVHCAKQTKSITYERCAV